MSILIRPAQEHDVDAITGLVNHFAEQDVMLPREEANVRATLADWLVAVDDEAGPDSPPLLGCGALVPLTETLVEIRSLAIHASQHGQGLGSRLVERLVEMARAREFEQVCALTLRESFFIRLGFELVDRWSISPKVWQACIYCRKFHHCDEVAVLMTLKEPAHGAVSATDPRQAAWSSLLKWEEWQPLLLAYQKKPQEAKLAAPLIEAPRG
jgi:amino-acid N-acetyltransferase